MALITNHSHILRTRQSVSGYFEFEQPPRPLLVDASRLFLMALIPKSFTPAQTASTRCEPLLRCRRILFFSKQLFKESFNRAANASYGPV
jgi:hypothetical protein